MVLAVPVGGSPLPRTPIRIVLIMITVPLIMTLTVSISVNSASTPTEKFNTRTKKKALISEIGMVTVGTNAEWKLRRNKHIMTNISKKVLNSAWSIIETEVLRNCEILHDTPQLTLGVKSSLPTLLTPVPTPRTILWVPEFGCRPTTTEVEGPLLATETTPQLLELNLTAVILPNWRIELLGNVPNMTLLHLLGASNPLSHRNIHRNRRGTPLESTLAPLGVVLTPREWTVVAILRGDTPQVVSWPGPSYMCTVQLWSFTTLIKLILLTCPSLCRTPTLVKPHINPLARESLASTTPRHTNTSPILPLATILVWTILLGSLLRIAAIWPRIPMEVILGLAFIPKQTAASDTLLPA